MTPDAIDLLSKFWWLFTILAGLLGWAFGLGWRARKMLTRVELVEAGLRKQHRDIVFIVLSIYAIVEGMGHVEHSEDVTRARDALQKHITENRYNFEAEVRDMKNG